MAEKEIISADQGAINEGIGRIPADTIVLVTDATTGSLFADRFRFGTRRVVRWTSPDGEAGKTFENYRQCAEHVLSEGIHRNAHLIALGGGAVSDFGGFVAATLLRGISWTAIPTTLLSMVDASIGGKTGINSAHGKNLIGAFHFPSQVWLNTEYLATLPADQILSGKGEILKYCFLDARISRAVSKRGDLAPAIRACADYKQRVVRKDPFEKGVRKVLNFGHTYGHAIEKALGLPHGIAVAAGIRIAFEHSPRRRELSESYDRLADALGMGATDLLGGRPWSAREASRIEAFVINDKKTVSRGIIDLVVVDEIGRPFVRRTRLSQIRRVIRRFAEPESEGE